MQPAPSFACACGSGLTAARCCAGNPELLLPSAAHRHLAPLEAQAQAAHQRGDAAAAEALCLDILQLAPGNVAALAVLFELRRNGGVVAAADALINRLLAVAPNHFWAVNEACLLNLARGNILQAEHHARNALRIAPDAAQAHYLMGLALTEAHRPAIAEYHYEEALLLSGQRDPAVLANLALCLKNQGKMAPARALYTEALARGGEVLHTLLGAARLEEADRQLDAALALLARAEAVQPDHPQIALVRATVLGRKGEVAAGLAELDRDAAADRFLNAAELLEKGRLLDKAGRYAEAFAAYDSGKAVLRESTGLAYLDEVARARCERLGQFFTRRRLAALPRASVPEGRVQPIFIVGFPRSGTTLLEQSLTAHPAIAAGDELPFINEIAALMPRMLDSPLTYPEALAELWMGDHREDLDMLRDHYLRRVAQLGIVTPGARWFTDKMPLNETHLGLIHMLFPQSPILHLIRHPLDVVLSVYSNMLTHGDYCAYALESIALHYMRTYQLIQSYRAELDLRYLPVRYEDIVDRQEATLRTVLDFVGEAFDPRCLDFHENTRYARTASYAQVTQKLYDSSRYRHRHYLAQLAPVVPVLRPAIEALGYGV